MATKIKSADQLKAEIAALQAELDSIESNAKEAAEREAHAKIAANLNLMDSLFAECARLADEHGISFSWDGPGYGSGGWYESGSWQSSSSSC